MMSENSMERQCEGALASLTDMTQVNGQVMYLTLTAMWNANKATTVDSLRAQWYEATSTYYTLLQSKLKGEHECFVSLTHGPGTIGTPWHSAHTTAGGQDLLSNTVAHPEPGEPPASSRSGCNIHGRLPEGFK